MIRPAPRFLLGATLAMVFGAGCSGSAPRLEDIRIAASSPSSEGIVFVVIGIEDLRTEAMDVALAEAKPPLPAVMLSNVRASGNGLEAAASPFAGRRGLDLLREPQAVGMGDWSFSLRGISPSLRSARGFGTLFGGAPVIGTDELAALPISNDVDVQVVLLDASAGRPAVLATVLDALAMWRARVDAEVITLVFGFPGKVDDPRTDLRVPVYGWRAEAAATTVDDAHPVALENLFPGAFGSRISAFPGRDPFHWAAWPESGASPGGVFATNGDLAMWSTAEGFAFEGTPEADTPAAREALAAHLATELFGGTPRAWIAVRGSQTVDFVDLSVFAHMPLTGRIEPWALEEIDNAWEPNENSVRYSLGAEDLGDGVIVDLGWPPYRFEVRMTGALRGSHWLGTPMFLGADAASWGFRALDVEPFSRAFWLASAGPWPKTADVWWPEASVGVHVSIDGASAAPVPATYPGN